METDSRAAARPWIIVAGQVLTTGGQDRANLALAVFLANRGRRVHVVSHETDAALGRDEHVALHVVRRPLGSDLLGEPFLHLDGTRLARLLAAQQPIVVANGGNCVWPGINWVHYVHAAYPRSEAGSLGRRLRMRLSHRYWLANERRALVSARLVIANSARTRRDLIERVGTPPERIRVIYYGIDPDAFCPAVSGEREATRAALGWAPSRPVMLFVGALGDRRKGFDTLFKAWSALRSRNRTTDSLLVVIGRGALLTEWREQVERASLASSIVFLGFRDDMPRIMRAADALVSPTRYEAYGLGVHEALACGLPAIVTADSGVAERYPASLRHLLLDDVEDPHELAERIEACISDLPRLGADMASFASTIRERTWDTMAGDIVDAAASVGM